MKRAEASQFMIQVDGPGRRLKIGYFATLLGDTGVKLDMTYGPLLINKEIGRYVLRGLATPAARKKAERLGGVAFFVDPDVASVRDTATCACGHVQDEHEVRGSNPEYPGSTACTVCDCCAFEEDHGE